MSELLALEQPPVEGYALRDYQCEAVDNTIEAFTNGVNGEPPADCALGVMATGAGKTVVFSFLIAHFTRVLGWRVLVLVDQIELAEQAREEMLEACGIYAQVEQGGNTASLDAAVVVGSVQTMSGRGLKKYPRDHFDFIICDEADRSLSAEWTAVLDHYMPHARLLGVTATPFRGDKKSLMPRYKRVVFNVPMFQLIDQGYLSPIEVQQLPIDVDLASIRQAGGDFDRDQLDAVLAPTFDKLVATIQERAADRRKVLVFTPLIPTSLRFVQACARAGLDARHVDGTSAERKRTLEWFHENTGRQRLLSNAMLLQRGWNEKSVDCIVILRPTRSRASYWQMVGRGTRLWCPNRCRDRCECAGAKRNLLLLDPLWQHGTIAPMRPADLIAETTEQSTAISRYMAKAGQARINLQLADSEVAREAEMALLQKMEAGAKRRPGNLVDAKEFAALAHRLDVVEYEPMGENDSRPASDKQKRMLENLGVNPDSVQSHGHASALIEVAMRRKAMGLSSIKQMRVLRKWGVKYPEMVSRKNASTYQNCKINRRPLPAGFELYAPPDGSNLALANPDGTPLTVADARAVVAEYDPDPEADRGPDPDDYEVPLPEQRPPPPVAPRVPGTRLGTGDFSAQFAALKRAVQGELF